MSEKEKEIGSLTSREGDVRDVRGDSDVRPAINTASPAIAPPQVSHAPAAPHAALTTATAAPGAGNPPQVSAAPVAPHVAPTAAAPGVSPAPRFLKPALIALAALAVVAAAASAVVVSAKRAAEATALAERAAAEAEKAEAVRKTAEKNAAAEEAKARAAEAEAQKATDNAKAQKAAKEAEQHRAAAAREEKERAVALRKAKEAEADAAREARQTAKLQAEAAAEERRKADAIAKAEKAKAETAASEKAAEDVRAEKTLAEAKLLELRKVDFETAARDLREWQQDLEERERALTPEKTIADLAWAGGMEDTVVDADGTVRKKAKVPYLAENDRTLPRSSRHLAKAERELSEMVATNAAAARASIVAPLERLYVEALKDDRVLDAEYIGDALRLLYPDWKFKGASESN